MADRVVDGGEAVQVQEDGRHRRPTRPPRRQLLGPLLQVGPVRQPGDTVVEGQVGDLACAAPPASLTSRAVTSSRSGAARLGVPGDRRLHVPPGAVGRAHPAGEPGQPRGAVARAQRHPGAAGPVLRVDQLGQRGARELVGRVTEAAPPPGSAYSIVPVATADQHRVAGPVGQLAELPARLPGQRRGRGLVPEQPGQPGHQRQHDRRGRDDDHRLGRAARQRPDERGQQGHGGGADGRVGRQPGLGQLVPAGPVGPGQAGQRRRDRAQHAHAQQPGQLRRPARVQVVRAGAHGQEVTGRREQQRPAGNEGPPARSGGEREHARQHRQVGQRVDEVHGEGPRAHVGRGVRARQHRDPGQEEQRGRQQAGVGQRVHARPGQPELHERGQPAHRPGEASTAMPITSGGSAAEGQQAGRGRAGPPRRPARRPGPRSTTAPPHSSAATASHRRAAGPHRAAGGRPPAPRPRQHPRVSRWPSRSRRRRLIARHRLTQRTPSLLIGRQKAGRGIPADSPDRLPRAITVPAAPH